MYTIFYLDKSDERRFVGSVMLVFLKEFYTYALQITDDVKRSNGRSLHVWKMRVKRNPLCCSNDLLDFEGNKTLEIAQMGREEMVNG